MTSETPTARETADAVRSGRLTALEAVDRALARIAEDDPRLHAFATIGRADARAHALRVDGLDERSRQALPLAGVPVAVKSNVETSAPVVRRLVESGAVPVGTTTTPELCSWGTTDSERHGVTRNPWDSTRTAGGSSGGSAAAVADGMVPLAHGNDGAGSLRIPAACCGVVTLKPGLGTLPTEIPPGNWGGMAEDGPLATTVADVALALAVMGDRPELAEPAALETSASDGLRVGTCTESTTRVGGRTVGSVATPWRRAVEEAARTLAEGDRGDGVGPLDLRPVDAPAPSDPMLLLARWSWAVAEDAHHLNLPLSAMERRNRHHALMGRTVFRNADPAAGDTRWNRAADRFRADAEQCFDAAGIDVLMTPTLAANPPEAAAWHLRSWPRNVAANARFAPMAAQWNVLGWPAMSVPSGTTTSPSGRVLPTAVQLIGRPGSEGRLLALAARLERLRPWGRTAP